jgi:hypothetical protein
VHAASDTGAGWAGGRTLRAGVDSVRDRLPCLESAYPYPDAYGGRDWENEVRRLQSAELTRKLGHPIIHQLNPSQIGLMKTFLAAGWVIVLGTTFPTLWQGQNFHRHGLPLTPLGGDGRGKFGHAWLVVGYEHVDGNSSWKYQGRFMCLNSWGQRWPKIQSWGPGVCGIPFSALLTEGVDAYAIRMQSKPN